MRARYLLGFVAALGIAAPADAQPVTGRSVPPTTRSVSPAVGGTGRVQYLLPPASSRGTAGQPGAAQSEPAQSQTVTEDIWAAPGTVRTQPAADALPPPTITQVRYQEPAQPPAKLPEVAPQPTPAPSKPVPAKPAPGAPPLAVPAYSSAFAPGTTVPCPTPECAPACAPACPPLTCEPACPCGPVPCAWVRAEWLFWVTSGQSLPPIASTSPAGTARDLAGRLSNASTAVLSGNDYANDNFRSGFRLTGGFWLDECGKWGIDGDFFFLGRSRDKYAAGSDANGSPIITRPFFNAVTGQADAELVSYPGVLRGTLRSQSQNSLIGGGVNGVHNLCCDACNRLDLIAGYRYLGLTDEVTITEDLTALAGQTRVPAGSRYQIVDRFRTENHFNGGVIGLSAEHRHGFCFVNVRASVALGAVTQITEISGSTTITPPGGTPTTYPGGLLAQSSNIGRYETTRFAVLPEVSLRAGVRVTNHCRAYLGYNFLYLSSVARAGDQIDVRVNTNQLPPQTVFSGPAVPRFLDATTGFWAQGVSFGVQYDF